MKSVKSPVIQDDLTRMSYDQLVKLATDLKVDRPRSWTSTALRALIRETRGAR